MKTSLSTKVLIATGVILVMWHLKVATSAKTRLSGLFMAKPAQPGYVWADLINADSRFFWDISDVKWKTGIAHPEFKAISAEKQGDWKPQPGYVFIDKSVDLSTNWEAGLLHPDFMAWSDKNEGAWMPVAGYKFVYTDGEITNAVWDPNRRYDDLKLVSLSQQDQYNPYPGYQFIEPSKSLKVVWVPGLVSSDNAQLMAGSREGSWIVANPRSPLYRSGGARGSRFGRRLGRAAENGAVRGVENGVQGAVERAFRF